jgi:hypothetical protein
MNSSRPSETFPLLWLNDLRLQAESQRGWLWQGYIAPGNVTLLTSQWKAGKTTLLSILLDRMKAGGDLAGRPVRAGRALVVSEESPAHWYLRSQKFDFTDQVCWLCRPFSGKPRLAEWHALLDQIHTLHEQVGLDLVAIDPLASFLPGGSENDADAMLRALLPLQRLTTAGPAVLVQHHPRKRVSADGQWARGSGALSGYVDILIEMHWYEEAADADRRRRLLAWSRYDETPRQLVIELNAAGTDYVCLGDFEEEASRLLHPTLWQVLESARTKLTRKEIFEQWPRDRGKVDPTSLWRLLERAVEEGDLNREGIGVKSDPFRYWLPSLEEKWAADPMARLQQTIADNAREFLRNFPPTPFSDREDLE